METSYLHSFLLVVETGSMAEAARRLDITAAAVAQQIRILEREFDAPLLARAGRTVLPTPAGHRLAQSAPQLLRELANAKTHVSQEGTAGELVIGTINTALHSLLPDILAGFVKKCPDAKVFLRSATTRELYEAVRQGELDAAVCLHPSFALAKTFDWTLLREEPLVLLVPRQLAHLDPHTLLRTQPLIRYDRSLGGGQMVERYLRAAQIAPQERFELSSLVAIAMMVDRGLGVSLVPDTALNLPDGQGVVRLALPEESQSRRFGVMWLRSSARLPLIHRLVDCARTVVKQRGGPRAAARAANRTP
ncbi:LysR family transcriptional regulator [Delftia tsuruhatensis]|jgi:DNA-binding transcriptional LysR family regulator|uniref:LysR family transcriptional regulator n=1 Tax=Delftia tsuruhatensis TaxID=180282 RepID=A0ABN4SEB5_9BURK|nr:LysR family transcriptional regulator [Delftia tsuruhatensis]AOV00492.1 LysR family transcriptional regulator [Delftia tsuruhatensis]KEH09327.1 LysR family transcriptional regulator [Delftia tsuruhatensis]MDH2229533.1 LysR family transcriptional regulator [Delftia tsuruhatensis]